MSTNTTKLEKCTGKNACHALVAIPKAFSSNCCQVRQEVRWTFTVICWGRSQLCLKFLLFMRSPLSSCVRRVTQSLEVTAKLQLRFGTTKGWLHSITRCGLSTLVLWS